MRLRLAGLAVVTTANVLLLALPARATADVTAPILLCDIAVLAVLVARETKDPRLPVALTMAAVAVCVLTAVAVWPKGSHDMWSYAIYGRMASVHHANPYFHAPAEFGGDPLLRLVTWQHTRSVYGPLFTLLSMGIATVTGASPLATRLAYQGMAGAAVLVLAVVVGRRRGSAGLLVVGLNPAVLLYVVNGGHNDALVAVALLACVLSIERGASGRAAGWGAVAASIKLVALLPVGALVVWMVRRHGVAAAAKMAAVVGAALVAGYSVFGGAAALRPVLAASQMVSRASLVGVLGRSNPIVMLAPLAVGAVLVLATSAATPSNRATVVAAAAVGAYLLCAAYVLPWYVVWGLPMAALLLRTWVGRVLWWQSLALVVAYQYRPAIHLDRLDELLRATSSGVAVFDLAAVVVLAALAVRLRTA
jgi:hypothetical protein